MKLITQSLAPEFEKARALIMNARQVFLTTHIDTHGDDLGALFAVQEVLESMRKEYVSVSPGEIPKTLEFLPGFEKLSYAIPESLDQFDLVMTFGSQTRERSGVPALLSYKGHSVSIDEHTDNTHWAEANIVSDQVSSTSELAYRFLIAIGVKITRNMATNLLTGIFTETGRFQHANTTPEVLGVAAELLKKGARIDRIASETYHTKGMHGLQAWAYAIEHSVLDEQRGIAYCVLTDEDMQKLGVKESDFDGVVDALNTVPEARFALVIKQAGDIIKGSLRSEEYKKVDVGRLARILTGGGHRLAAGFEIPGKIVKKDGRWKVEVNN